MVACAALCGACNHHNREFLDTIPANCPFIAQADIDATLKMAGCESHAGALSLTPAIKQLLAMADSSLLPQVECAVAMGRYLDLSQTYLFMTDNPRSLILTAPRRTHDMRGLPEGEDADCECLYDATLYDLGATSMLCDNSQGWIALWPVPDLPACVDTILMRADSIPLSGEPLLTDFLGGASLVRACIPMPRFANPFGENFSTLLLSVDFTDRALAVIAQGAEKNRIVAPLSMLAGIDAYPMGRMPFAPTFAFTVGLDGGTTAMAAAPGGNAETIKHLDLDNWLVKVLIPAYDREIDQLPGWLARALDARNIYLECDSDFVAITNFNPEDFDIAYEESPQANGEKVIASATVPYRSEAMKAFNLNQGYLLNAYATDSLAEAYLRPLGPSTYLLPTLINDLIRCAPSLK